MIWPEETDTALEKAQHEKVRRAQYKIEKCCATCGCEVGTSNLNVVCSKEGKKHIELVDCVKALSAKVEKLQDAQHVCASDIRY